MATLLAELDALRHLLPEVPEPAPADHPRRTIGDLAKLGALTLHQQSLTRLELSETGAGPHVLTGRDVASGTDPTLRLPEPNGDLLTLRPGDLVVPYLSADTIKPMIVTKAHETLLLGPNLHLIRVNPALLDVHYLAGYLAATPPNGTSLSGVHRLDLRRITIPVPDLETQRALGKKFRHLTEFHTRLNVLTETADTLITQLGRAFVTNSSEWEGNRS